MPESKSPTAPDPGPDLLRFLAAGSVDDGKSTLIGRLLYDSKSVYEDHLRSLEKDSLRGQAGGAIDYSLLTDGLLAEREQGITIDVAYRYFSTPRRKFIIADTPGHEQYTRNMATGASTANLAIVLIDAEKGVLPQTRRHAFIASLLGIRHLAVAVNKMDLVDYSREVFERIRRDFSDFAARLEVSDVQFLPISALKGDNVVTRSPRTPWYQGPPLLEHLETVHIASDRNLIDLRFPVQLVLRPDRDFRGYAGTVASGRVRPGDEVIALPGGTRSRVKAIETRDGARAEAFPPLAVTLTLEDEIDLSRGDMLVHPGNRPEVARAFEAMVVWMSEQPLDTKSTYLVKHTTATVRARVATLRYRVDVDTIHRVFARELRLNEIGRVRIECARPLMLDPYKRNRATGALILIDPTSNATLGAGMVLDHPSEPASPGAPSWAPLHSTPPTPAERASRLGQAPCTLWLAGPASPAKAAFARRLERALFDLGRFPCLVDVDGEGRDAATATSTPSPGLAEASRLARRLEDLGLIVILAAADPGDGSGPSGAARLGAAELPRFDAADLEHALAVGALLLPC